MKALILEGVRQLAIRDVPAPAPAALGVVLRVQASGVCRSDWHAWVGDSKRDYPMVIGHEMVGVVEEVMPGVTRFKKGDRVVVPLSGSDGVCAHCQWGSPHLCDNPLIPGRSYSGVMPSTSAYRSQTAISCCCRKRSASPKALRWAAVS